jgi:hypothetical protein
MRDINRIERIIHDLERLWKQYPDQRLGQILENYVFNRGQRGDKTSCALYYQEDNITQDNIILNTDFQHPSPFVGKVVQEK